METSGTGPLVSVIVPSYNHAPYVRECLASIRAQSYPRIELIVIDDASHDDSADLIAAAQREQAFVFLRNERNLGLNASLERGLASASGEFVSLLASDDLMLPSKIAEQVEYLQQHGGDGVFASGLLLHPDGRREGIAHDELAAMFNEGRILRHIQTSDTYGPLLQSGLFRTSMMRELAPVRRQFKSDDWALALHMLEKYRVGFLNRPLFVYRQHEKNTFRDYWRTFPMRVEVLSQLTPHELRLEGLANLFESQAAYLEADRQATRGLRFRLAAFALDPSARRVLRTVRAMLQRLRLSRPSVGRRS